MINKTTRRRFLVSAMGLPIALAGTAWCFAADAGGATHEVIIKDFKFSPATLKVKPGDRVRWINRDLSPHTATARDGSWDTGELKQGESAEVVIRAFMSEHYFCAYHPGMRGKFSTD